MPQPLITNPYLHTSADGLYNPLTDARVACSIGDISDPSALSDELLGELTAGGFLVAPSQDLSSDYYLKYVSIESHTTCNHKCYFCPVSVHTRPKAQMSLAFFTNVVEQLNEFSDTLKGVFLNGYNEPTTDANFLEYVSILKQNQLGVAVNSNGSGLTPAKIDAIAQMGGLDYLCINLSTLNAQEFAKDRGATHLELVLRNMDYIAKIDIAKDLSIVVLGRDDEQHESAHREIVERFNGSTFEIKRYKVNSRSGNVDVFQERDRAIKNLKGCEQTGSRPIQHLHINAYGECILCCQDYFDQNVVGDLNTQSIKQVLEGPKLAQMRRWIYGVEQAPDDFICRRCAFALSTDESRAKNV